MRTEEWERLIEEKGQKRGEKAGQEKERIRIICTNLQKGRSAEDIADFLGEDAEEIGKLCHIAGEFAPEYDVEKIYSRLKNT